MDEPIIATERLTLVAATAEYASAALEDPEEFGRRLNAIVPKEWPPAEMGDAQEVFARALNLQPHLAGWLHWYWLRTSDRMLIGSGGFGGRPSDSGQVEMGYSVLDRFQGMGYASEAVAAQIDWSFQDCDLVRIIAVVNADNEASRRVLVKTGFQRVRDKSGEGTIEYEHRRPYTVNAALVQD